MSEREREREREREKEIQIEKKKTPHLAITKDSKGRVCVNSIIEV